MLLSITAQKKGNIMKIYVACLAAYNNGQLHGSWIEVSTDVEEMQKGINKVLQSSPQPAAEEHAIHDYDDFPNLGEYPTLEKIAEVAELIESSDYDVDTVKAVIDYADDIEGAQKMLDDNHGVWDSFQEYADDLADEMMGCHNCKGGEWLHNYFDYEKYARDIEQNYAVIDVPSGVFVAVA
jgi:antirestriction protein